MKVQSKSLSGNALTWAVAHVQNLSPRIHQLSGGGISVCYSGNQAMPFTEWTQGGKLVDDEDIDLDSNSARAPHVRCRAIMTSKIKSTFGFERVDAFGPTKLIAAMRCLIIAAVGKEIDIPDELVDEKLLSAPDNDSCAPSPM